MKKKTQMDKPQIPICRICGSQFNLMHVLQGGQELLEKLWLCANIQIDFEGSLPKHLCLKCEQGLNFSYRLRKQGEAMELRLRQQEQDTNLNEVNLADEVDDVEESLQEFRVANAKQAQNSVDDEVQIIYVTENAKANQGDTLNFEKCTIKAEAVNATMQHVEANEFPIINVNNMVTNLMPITETRENTDIVNLEDEVFNEFAALEDDFNKKEEHSLDFRQEYIDEQDIIEIVEDIPAFNDIDISSVDQFSSLQNSNDLQQNNDDEDDVQIIADYPSLNSDTLVVNSETSNKTQNYDIQQHIVEYLERSRPVKVKIINCNETSSQVQETQNDKSYMQQHTKEIAVLKDTINDIIDFDVDNENNSIEKCNDNESFDNENNIIQKCNDNESFGEYVDAEFPEDSFEFETLEKYSIDLGNVVSAVIDTTQQETSSNSVVENYRVPQNRSIAMDTRMAFKCDTCSEVFLSQSEYRFHIKLHGRERYNCLQCNKWFPTRYRLQQHERIHNNVDMYQCELCENSYRHRQNLKRHLISAHAEQKAFNCNQCQEVFARADILKNHMTKHTNDRNFICELCSKSFKSNFYLMSHKRSHQLKANAGSKRGAHSGATNTCTSTSDESSNPTQTESNKRTYYCIHCGKISKHHFAHKNHLRTHTFEMPYGCEFCKKKFRTMAARITHERIHTDDRPYQCERCYLSFRQSSHLKQHMLMHDGVMSHVCNICNMAFTKKSNMKVHMRIHTGERPYKCAEMDCGQQFSKLAQLKRHAAQTHARNVEVLANEEDDELSSGNETEQDEVSDRFESEELDVGIGAEETAIELVNDSHYNSLYIFDEIGTR